LIMFYLNEFFPWFVRDFVGPIGYRSMVAEFNAFQEQVKK